MNNPIPHLVNMEIFDSINSILYYNTGKLPLLTYLDHIVNYDYGEYRYKQTYKIRSYWNTSFCINNRGFFYSLLTIVKDALRFPTEIVKVKSETVKDRILNSIYDHSIMNMINRNYMVIK